MRYDPRAAETVSRLAELAETVSDQVFSISADAPAQTLPDILAAIDSDIAAGQLARLYLRTEGQA